MEYLGQTVSTVNNLAEFFNAWAGLFTSVSGALVGIGGALSLIVTFCSALATRMPKPNDTAPLSYILIYRFVNKVAFNYGHAENK